MSVLVYDCEIKHAIPDKNGKKVKGIKYCGGWTDFTGMGISCIAVYDYELDIYRNFCDDNLKMFQKLIDTRDLVIGFNSRRFDDELVKAHGIVIDKTKACDLMIKVKEADGIPGDKIIKGYSLDNIAKANLTGIGKSGIGGAQAPIDWQRGKIGGVIDYCINDVWLLKQLVDMAILENLKSPVTGRTLNVRFP